MLPQLQQIAAQAAADSDRVFTNRAHRIEKEWLRQAYELTRKDGAVGVGSRRESLRGKAFQLP